MADYRIKLSDGVDTIDLYGGSDTSIRDAGFGLLPPNAVTSFIGNPTFDGNRLGQSRYGNRRISMTVKIVGTSVSDLKDNIRTVQRLLNDAQERSLLGYGSQVFLEYQWGDTINESVFYDVIRGDLLLPRGFQTAAMANGYTIPDATLSLICKPFGRYIEQDIATDTLENCQQTYETEVSFIVDDDGAHTMDSTDDKEAQTFTTAGAFTVVGAAIKCYRQDVPGDITFEIYAVDSHLPTGSALASGTASGDTVGTSEETADWLICDFNVTGVLSAATEYALVVYAGSLPANHEFSWQTDPTKGYGTDGQRAFITDGGGWTADDTDDSLFAIYSVGVDVNYQDVTTTAAYGDVPAGLYYKLTHDAATTKKIWIAKRSGLRQKNDLWIEGEDETTSTNIVGGSHGMTLADVGDLALSSNKYGKVDFAPISAISADTQIARMNYDINDLPRGQFRVLIYCRTTDPADNTEYADMAWALGWSYGDKSYAPTLAAGDYVNNTADVTWEILDLGILNIPPIAESDIAINNKLDLRIYQIAEGALGANTFTDPTDNTDPDEKWAVETRAYDNGILFAECENIPTESWGGFLDLTRAAMDSVGVRYFVHDTTAAEITLIDVDAYYDAGWHDVYEGSFTEEEWIYKYFADGYHNVTKYRFRFYNSDAGAVKNAYLEEVDFLTGNLDRWDLDYIFLLPMDEGVVIIDDVATGDIIASDGITDPPNVFIIGSTNDIENFPDYVGNPFLLGRESTRIYVLRDDAKTVTFSSNVKYQPRFMVV